MRLITISLQAQRLHEKKEHSTQEQALDPKTRLLLFKMVDAGILEEVNGCVSTGKEACVYHACGGKYVQIAVPCTCEALHHNGQELFLSTQFWLLGHLVYCICIPM